MHTHITCLYGHAYTSTAMLAQIATADSAKEMGFDKVPVYSYPVEADSESELRTRLDGIFSGVGFGDFIVLQYPTWNNVEFDQAIIRKLRAYPRLKIAIYIHDVLPLMFEPNAYLMPTMIEIYNMADVLIVPTEAMYQRLRQEGLQVDRYVVQEMWDHPIDLDLDRPEFIRQFHFAGDVNKFNFAKNWQSNLPLRVYSRDPETALPDQVITCGFMRDTELIVNLAKGGFGLVWADDDHINEYFKLCITHKLGTYLAAGIPVVVPRHLSNHDIIEANHLGLVADSLEEAQDYVANISAEDYDDLVDHVDRYRPLITQGFYTKRVLTEAIFKCVDNRS